VLPAAGVPETRWADKSEGSERTYLSIGREQEPTKEAVMHMGRKKWNREGYNKLRGLC